MKVVVISGTAVKGCTYQLKSIFISALPQNSDITEFTLPTDLPYFCSGCKACFLKSESSCPQYQLTDKIWTAMQTADLIVFAYPVYVMRAPAQLKALLDFFAYRFMVHRPDPKIFNKHAVILTQSIGAPNKAAQKDVVTSLNWWGISNVKRLGFALREGAEWNKISAKRRQMMTDKLQKLAKKYHHLIKTKPNLKVRLLFWMAKSLHKKAITSSSTLTADNKYWRDTGLVNTNI